MTYIVNEEEVAKIKALEGEVRGVALKTDEFYVLKNKGEEGLKKVEEALQGFGVEIDYKTIERMNYYPISLRIFSLLAIAKAFEYGKEEVEEMGKRAPRVSFLIKFFAKYFMSSDKTLEKVDDLWKKHYTKGRVEAGEIDEAKGVAVFRIYDADFHPIFCDYLCGYFVTIIAMVIGKEAYSKEEKCTFNGDDCHEIRLTFEPDKI